MARKISTDTEYWQLREDYETTKQAEDAETDAKRKKELHKTAQELSKVLNDYEKKKIKDTMSLVKKEIRLSKLRSRTKVNKQIFFHISPIEAKYIDFASLSEKERNHLSVKKESLLEMMKKGMYVKLKDDSGIYQVKQSPDYLEGMTYLSTARYSDIAIQDVALIIERYFYESELKHTGHEL